MQFLLLIYCHLPIRNIYIYIYIDNLAHKIPFVTFRGGKRPYFNNNLQLILLAQHYTYNYKGSSNDLALSLF